MEVIHVLLTEIGAVADSSCEHTQVLVIEQVHNVGHPLVRAH